MCFLGIKMFIVYIPSYFLIKLFITCRYCPAKYYPFDPSDLDKYVIGDDYLPTWEVPSLASVYTSMGYGMKDSFDYYVRSQVCIEFNIILFYMVH